MLGFNLQTSCLWGSIMMPTAAEEGRGIQTSAHKLRGFEVAHGLTFLKGVKVKVVSALNGLSTTA
jgi:hypothetical protein